MLDGLDAQRGGDVRLAGARATDQNDIVGTIDKLATMQLADMASLISLEAKSKPVRSL
jgi:hypothetical protein